MATNDVANTPEPEATETTEETCPACTHPMSAHDVIGARFCVATTAGGLSRGCACHLPPKTAQTPPASAPAWSGT
ncbi:MAG TPA: RGCVC family protein [Pseudonocardiaceae bacterium]|jgi:hypothetical protein|nr:RGCVC family protein [Pseudonocardiaceae bacterium]